MYLPLPILWGISSQLESRWIFQAKRMNGDLGFYRLKADQMAVMSSLLLLILMPIFEIAVYPVLRRIGVRRPLQKMVIGVVFSTISFIIAGILQIQTEAKPTNSVHMMWQIPQMFVNTIGDIMFQVIGK